MTNTYGQSNNNIWKDDLVKRGYKQIEFLFQNGNTQYFATNPHLSDPTILAVHDIGVNSPILDVTIKDFNLNGRKFHKIIFSENEKKLITEVIIEKTLAIHLKDLETLHKSRLDFYRSKKTFLAYNIFHYVKGVYLDGKDPVIATTTSKWPHSNRSLRSLGYEPYKDDGQWRHAPFEFQRFHFNTAAEAIAYDKVKQQELIKKENEKKIAKEKKLAKKELEITSSINNPSGKVLKINLDPKGRRFENGVALAGKENTIKIIEMGRAMEFELQDEGRSKFRPLDEKKYFEDIFYGNFEGLNPKENNSSLLGTSSDYFPEFHNAFLYYTNQKFGNNYFSNMAKDEFEIITTKTTKDGYGNVISSYNVRTPYKVFLPKVFLLKFSQFRDENQFSETGERFNIDFEYLILSFLDNYGPNTMVFKQMMQNLYRYSMGKVPVNINDNIDDFKIANTPPFISKKTKLSDKTTNTKSSSNDYPIGLVKETDRRGDITKQEFYFNSENFYTLDITNASLRENPQVDFIYTNANSNKVIFKVLMKNNLGSSIEINNANFKGLSEDCGLVSPLKIESLKDEESTTFEIFYNRSSNSTSYFILSFNYRGEHYSKMFTLDLTLK